MAKFSEILRANGLEDHTTLEGYENATLRLYGKGKKRLMKFDIKDSDLAMVGGTHARLTVQGDVFYIGDEFYDTSDEYERSVPGAAVRVIYNPPATIAIWADGSKTVVRCDKDDVYDPKYGLALCYMKKALGSSRAFNDALRAGMDGWKEYQRKKDVEEKWASLSDDEKKNLQTVRKMLACVEPSKYLDSDFLCPINASMCEVCPYKKLPFTECRNKLRLDIERIMDDEKVTKHD